jgi:polyisoprenoid-binding protein YceI
MRITLFIICLVINTLGYAQKYSSTESTITFFSEAPIENITATNRKASSILNIQTKEVAFSVPIIEFQFEKKLMQQHFNERYMESEKYPRATFVGKLEGFDESVTTLQPVVAKGKLTIHGITRELSIHGKMQMQHETITARAMFYVALVDHKIEVPKLLWENIAETIKITVDFTYKAQKL